MERLTTIYLKTYNFVYLHAKSIFTKEEDVQRLMREVYVRAIEEDVPEDRLYSWLGNTIYSMGCSKFRKKNVSEAKGIDLDEREYHASNTVYVEKTIDSICEKVEELPDMYMATLYAFYYDHLTVKEIAGLMGYSYKAILHRLNYAHKYLSKSLEHDGLEAQEDIEFSVEMLCKALEAWNTRNSLSANVAQNIYLSICRELGIRPEYECQDDEVAGSKNRIGSQGRDIEVIFAELRTYKKREPAQIDVKKLIPLGWLAAVIALIIALFFACQALKDHQKPTTNVGGNTENTKEEEEDEGTEEGSGEGNEEGSEEGDGEQEEQQPDLSSEYVVPNSDTVLLTRADLAHLTFEELGLARNEIFARHGMIFGLQYLKDHFESKSWYRPEVSVDDFYKYKELSSIEESNIALILQLEEELRP